MRKKQKELVDQRTNGHVNAHLIFDFPWPSSFREEDVSK